MGVDGLLSVAHNILATDNEYFDIFIDGVNDQVFSLETGQLNDIAQSISSLLAKAESRPVGIRLLNKYLDQCSTEVFTRTGNLWTSLVLKSCQGGQQQDCCSDAYEAFGKLALKSLQTPDSTKSFATTHLTKVYECLTNASGDCLLPALQCIESCLRLYPSASGPSKRVVEKFLARFHDSLDSCVVAQNGKCLHLLQQVSGGEAHSSNHKTLWKTYQIQLVGSIHDVFDLIFLNCPEMWDDKVVPEKLSSLSELELSPEPITKAAQLYVRGHNLINYLISALKEPFPVDKPLLPKMLLSLMSRGLSVNCNMLHLNPISDNIALALLLPKIHLDLLHLLDVAIIVLRGHLLPFNNQILALLVDVMKSTAENENYISSQKPFRQLRAKVYSTIELWCKVQSAGSRCEAIAEHLIQEILKDIMPKTSELTLQVSRATSRHTSKKLRRQMQKAQNDRSNIAQSSAKSNRTLKASYNDERNQLLCEAALKCLQALLTSAGSFIKPTKIKVLQSSLIHISCSFYELQMDAAQLFGSSRCRLEMYNTLYVLMTTPHHLCPPPADILLALLNNGSYRDGNMKVRSHCAWILQNIEKIIHPQKESLVFPIDAREIRNTFIMMGQEKLLGQGQMEQGQEDADDDDDNDDYDNNDYDNNDYANNEDVITVETVQTEECIIYTVQAEETQANVSYVLEEAEQTIETQTQTHAVVLHNELIRGPSVNENGNLNDSPQRPPKTGKRNFDSPQTISDSDSYNSPSRGNTVDISSGDDCMSLKLRVDEESDPDEVEIVSVEPLKKRPRMYAVIKGEIIYIEDSGDAIKDNAVVATEKPESNNDGKEEATAEAEDEPLNTSNTSADDIIMNLDEDALVDDIVAQFVDDLAIDENEKIKN